MLSAVLMRSTRLRPIKARSRFAARPRPGRTQSGARDRCGPGQFGTGDLKSAIKKTTPPRLHISIEISCLGSPYPISYHKSEWL